MFGACDQVQSQKKLMNNFRENFKSVNLNPHMAYLPHFGPNKKIF